MRLVLAVAALVLVPTAGLAADAPGVAAPAQAARFNLDTPIETIMADAAGAAVIEAAVPGTAAHPHYAHFKAMSLRQVSAMAPDKLTAEVLAKLETALAQIK